MMRMQKEIRSNFCKCGCGVEIAPTRTWVSGHNLKRRPKDAIVIKGRLYNKTNCTECGKEFIKRDDSIREVNLCSRKCSGIRQSRVRTGVPLDILKTGNYYNCHKCNKEFYRTKAYSEKAEDDSKRFCSRDCLFTWRNETSFVPKNFIGSADNSGKNNGRYKHGKRVGAHINKKELRIEVIERDGGNWCLFCGKPAPGLHLHRIHYGAQGGKYELDNCIQLCPEHHGEVHTSKVKWQPILLDHIENGTLYNNGLD